MFNLFNLSMHRYQYLYILKRLNFNHKFEKLKETKQRKSYLFGFDIPINEEFDGRGSSKLKKKTDLILF